MSYFAIQRAFLKLRIPGQVLAQSVRSQRSYITEPVGAYTHRSRVPLQSFRPNNVSLRSLCTSSDNKDGVESGKKDGESKLEKEFDNEDDGNIYGLNAEEDRLVDVRYDVDENNEKTGVVIVTFNCPDKLNPMTVAAGKAFQRKLRVLRRDHTITALVLTGEGKAFSAGGDLQFLIDRTKESPTDNIVTMRHFYDRFLSIRRVPFPTIAAINGHAVGAGCCLTLACDMRMISEDAKFGLNFVRLGLSPGMGGTHFLPAVSNPQVAARLMLTGELIKAQEAKELGLVLSVHPKDEVLKKAIEMGRKISEASPTTVKMVVQSLRKTGDSYSDGLTKALDAEARAQAQCYALGDMLEGINAIKEKRKPVFGFDP